MKTVNIHEAKTQLSKLIEEASKGEAFIIAKAGKPVVIPRKRASISAATTSAAAPAVTAPTTIASGVAARIVHPDTFAPLPIGQEGLLLIYGANVMKGYLDKPELTAKSLHEA